MDRYKSHRWPNNQTFKGADEELFMRKDALGKGLKEHKLDRAGNSFENSGSKDIGR